MFGETNYKVSKKLLKQIKSDLDAIISFEKNMKSTLSDKRLHPELKKKLSLGVGLMGSAENNTTRIRREVLEVIRNKNLIIKD